MRGDFQKSLVIGMIAGKHGDKADGDVLTCDVSYYKGQLEIGLKVLKNDCTTENVAGDYLIENANNIQFSHGWEPFYLRRLKSLLDSGSATSEIKFPSKTAFACTELQAEEAFSLPSGRPGKPFKSKQVSFAIPTSDYARHFGRAAYFLEVDYELKSGPLDSVAEAEALADSRFPECRYSNNYLQKPKDGSKLCQSQLSMK